MNKPLLVQKYGGATLADPDKIRGVAQRIADISKTHHMIVAVSAMGQTTNQLIELAQKVSPNPSRREMDMLLSAGERMSMALLSIALNDLRCSAISFTGSQAGILTDDSHENAFIVDVKPIRVEQALREGKIPVIAGFQGVSPVTKEITTLGRGGTDTTAVAMAAHFKAERCEILKDVAGVYTADPKIVESAKPILQLNYEQLMEMTYWGAKVLHYRSVELARNREVELYIGPSNNKDCDGTLVKKGCNMFESSKPLSVNSHETVLELGIEKLQPQKALEGLIGFFNERQIAFPQILKAEPQPQGSVFLVTGPQEIMRAIEKEAHQSPFKIHVKKYATVSLTCTGVTSYQIFDSVVKALEKDNIEFHKILSSAMSVTLVLRQDLRQKAIQAVHALIQD